jgi:hypothetical protein
VRGLVKADTANRGVRCGAEVHNGGTNSIVSRGTVYEAGGPRRGLGLCH